MTATSRTTEPEPGVDAGGPLQPFVGLPLHDCCATHCRDWNETQGGLLPPSGHSPGCQNFRLERFARITYSTGASCFTEWPGETEWTELAVDDESEPPTMAEIWMTRDQFDRLEEFSGP